jgi:putative N6-adenine-specific DNA methylase
MNLPKNIERRIRQHVYAQKQRFFAVVHPGFEKTAYDEMLSLIDDISDVLFVEGGIEFTADVKDMWVLHCASSCITRIMMRLSAFKAIYFNIFKDKMQSIPWELHLEQGCVPEFSITCHHSKLYHTGRLEQESLKAVSARMAVHFKEVSDPETKVPAQTIFIRFEDDRCTVSLDCTGEPLYRRGFRTFVENAPLRETYAASILSAVNVKDFDEVLDPMCGSGVFALEAALVSQGILPGSRRSFSFELWPGHSPKGYDFTKKNITVKTAASAKRFAVFASDNSDRAVTTARSNAEFSGLVDAIRIEQKDFFSSQRSEYPCGKMLIVMNPPYGKRIPVVKSSELYAAIGIKLKNEFAGCTFAIIVPRGNCEKALGLKSVEKIAFINGGIKLSFLYGSLK